MVSVILDHFTSAITEIASLGQFLAYMILSQMNLFFQFKQQVRYCRDSQFHEMAKMINYETYAKPCVLALYMVLFLVLILDLTPYENIE